MNDAGELGRHIGLRSAIALVIANVIGAGIFTTTGFQAAVEFSLDTSAKGPGCYVI